MPSLSHSPAPIADQPTPSLPGVVFGRSLEQQPGEIDALIASVRARSLRSKKRDVTKGDLRFWGVDVSQSAILQRLKAFGEAQFERQTGKPPAFSFVMVNHVDARTCPIGSGAGWHRDAFAGQYKAFVYLTDVDRESQGPFCYLPASNSWLFLLPSLLHRLATGGHRYRDWAIDLLRKVGVKRQPVHARAGVPFFTNTAFVHRGLPISEGERIAATLYMYGDFKTDNYSPDYVDMPGTAPSS
jgi:hypothetical protein